MQINYLILYSLLLLLLCFILPSNSQTLNPSIRTYEVTQLVDSISQDPIDKFLVYSKDSASIFQYNNERVNYFIVSDGKGGSNMYYDTSNGFTIESNRKFTIDGSLVKLYQTTSITICISKDNCYIGSNNTFIIQPKELVVNVEPIPTRGGVVNINVKYFYNVQYNDKITIQDISTNDFELPIYGDSSNKRYFNISDEYSGKSGTGFISLNNIEYTVSINFIEPTITNKEENGNNLILYGDNFGKYISKISVAIGNETFSSTNTQMSVFNHSLLNITLSDNYLPRFTNLIIWVNSNPSLQYPIKIGPFIQSITPISYKGGRITIIGNRLMVNQGLSIKVGTRTCKSPTQIEYPKSFYCTLDSGLYIPLVNVTVSVANVPCDPYLYNIKVPRIDSYNQINSVVSFDGLFEEGSKVIFNGGIYTPLSLNETNILFQLEYKFKSGMVTIGTSSYNITEYKLDIYPTIIDTTPTPTEGGNTTFSVAWSGNSDEFNQVIVAGKDCLNVVQMDISGGPLFRYYQCQAGPGVGINYLVEATINGKTSTTLFSYDKPNIKSIEQNGNELYIIGDNFGDEENITVGFFDVHTIPIKVTSHHVYKIQIPEESDGDLTITVGGQLATHPVSLYPAIVSNITELTTDGGINTLTLMFIRTSNPTIYIGEKECTNVTKVDSSDVSKGTNYTCIIPKGTGINNLLTLSTDTFTNITSSPIYNYRYQAPRVNSSNLIPVNTSTLTIHGSSFGSEEFIIPIVTVGNFTCYNVTVYNSTTLSCEIDGNDIKSTPKRHQYVNVTVDGLVGSSLIPVFDVLDSEDIATKESSTTKNSLKIILPVSIICGLIFLGLVAFVSIKLYKNFNRVKPSSGSLSSLKTLVL